MKKKKTILVKHIHSCSASASGSDKWLYTIVDAKDVDFTIKEGKAIKSDKHSFINNAVIDEIFGDKFVSVVYLKSDKTFYDRGLNEDRIVFEKNYSETQEFFDLVNMYINKGFNLTERPKELRDYYKRAEALERKKMKAAGNVLWMSYDDRTVKDYQGGFSNELFSNTSLSEYISQGCIYGWIGHSVRTFILDKVIEDGLRERGLSSSKMTNWITSGDGRHFGNSLEGLNEKEQIKQIKKYLNSMFNLCLIYGENSHKGTLKSTQEIRKELQEKGWLLPE